MTSPGSFPAPQVSSAPPPSNEAPRPSEAALAPIPDFRWQKNLALFFATVVSVFFVGQNWTAKPEQSGLEAWLSAWTFALPLLLILVTHEFGHYVAARIHRVPASLPYFIPLPILNPFGTLGAVIIMPRRIRSANALLDIGAAGPLAGMVVAVPIMIYGLSLSSLGPVSTENYIQEGQSLLYWALKHLVFGAIPAGQDVHLHPTALAAWAGFLVTFLNMIPVGQLDGGHVAYALIGKRQNRIARWVLWVPLALAVYNFFKFVWPIIELGNRQGFDKLPVNAWFPVSAVTIWLTAMVFFWFLGRGGHPPVDHSTLSPVRKLVAILTLLMLVGIFMPSPWVVF